MVRCAAIAHICKSPCAPAALRERSETIDPASSAGWRSPSTRSPASGARRFGECEPATGGWAPKDHGRRLAGDPRSGAPARLELVRFFVKCSVAFQGRRARRRDPGRDAPTAVAEMVRERSTRPSPAPADHRSPVTRVRAGRASAPIAPRAPRCSRARGHGSPRGARRNPSRAPPAHGGTTR